MGQPPDTTPTAQTSEKPPSTDFESARDPPKPLILSRLNAHLNTLSGFEARGLERVPPTARTNTLTLHMLMLWFSANLTVNNLTVPMLGPLLMGLGFTDSTWCMIVGVALGSISTAYMSTWGPVSGCRTMVVLRFAWLPQAFALFVLVGVAGPNFNASLQSTVSGSALAAARFTFVTLCFYVPNSWAAAGADFYVYYPEATPKWKVFTLTTTGLVLSFCFVNMLGIGLACGVSTSPTWQDAYSTSAGALIVESFGPLGGFGKFCSVILALGVIANCVPGSYAGAICSQTLGRYFARIPRWLWVVFLVIIQLVLGVAGRNKLFPILQNFLALMGYWLMPMIAIVLLEHLIFKRRIDMDWTAWSQPKRLPLGFAALAAFLLGWVGAILGMYETWFVGPLAKAAGSSDVGMWIGTGFTMVSYAPVRYMEIKMVGR